jgi:hypothetical protein
MSWQNITLQVVAAVGYCLDVTRQDPLGRSSLRHLVQARQLAIFLVVSRWGFRYR